MLIPLVCLLAAETTLIQIKLLYFEQFNTLTENPMLSI